MSDSQYPDSDSQESEFDPDAYSVEAELDSEPEIVPDRRKLSAGAAAIRDKFTIEEREEIAKAPCLSYVDAMERLSTQQEGVAMQDLNLAIIISGMENEGESEVTITNMLNNMQVSWPQLSKNWLNDLRKAVLYIRGSADRAAVKGTDKNIINEDDFLELCSFGAKALEEDNRVKPTMFQRGNLKVVLFTDPESRKTHTVVLDIHKFIAKLNLIAQYRQVSYFGENVLLRGVSVPRDVANQLFNTDLNIPSLAGVVTAPTFTGDGDLIKVPGFHSDSGHYYAKPTGLRVPRIPRHVKDADLRKALGILVEELFGDFELDGVGRKDLIEAALGGDVDNPPPASLLNAIGLLIEQFVRQMIDGPVMPHLITKTAKGAGGGLLSNCMQIIIEGMPSSRPLPKNEEERRKAITTALKGGARTICWDNVAGDLSSPSIASVTTEDIWVDRILGVSHEAAIPIRSSFMLVGIRPLLSDELRRRMSLIEMKPQTAKPEERNGFRHEFLTHYVKKHRGDFIWAILVLVLNWIQKGRPSPMHAPIIGSYQAYRHVVGGIIEAAAPNWTTWQSNRSALAEIASDGEGEDIENLLCAWWAKGVSLNGDEAVDLCDLAQNNMIALPIKRVPQGGEFEYSTRSMGRYLKGYVGRYFIMEDGTEVELCQSEKRGKGGYPWILRKVMKPAEAA